MKKIVLTLLVIAGVLAPGVSFAGEDNFESPPAVPDTLLTVADFPSYAMAVSGSLGKNRRSIPNEIMFPSRSVILFDKTAVTCAVDSNMKAMGGSLCIASKSLSVKNKM